MLVNYRHIFYPLTVLLLVGCASASIFVSYPAQMLPIKKQINSRQYSEAQEKLEAYRNDADNVLYMMERGRVAYLANDNSSSIDDFRQVIALVEAQQEKAKISLTDTAAQGSALLLNDNAIPYVAQGYERVFVHHYQALNYLFSNNIEAAQVEVRRANEEQNLALELHEDELADAEEEGGQMLSDNMAAMESLSSMDSVAARVKNSFQNAYTFYVSGLIYETQGEYNDAYIDYKKALEIFPNNQVLQDDVLRLAAQLGMRDDYKVFKKRLNKEARKIDKDSGQLVVLFETGFVPAKLETHIGIFVGNHVQKIAFPVYASQWRESSLLDVSLSDGTHLGVTSPIVHVQAMAVKSLQEKVPAMLTRQILRVMAKRNMSEQVGKAGGPLAQFATDVFNIISENADRRSWLTLPGEAQILKSALPAGEYRLKLRSGPLSETMTVRVQAGRHTIVRVTETGRLFHTNAIVI